MKSTIKWQTGEPKDSGMYLITTNEGKIGIYSFFVEYPPDIEFFKMCVTAWCKLIDIEPYKEESK